MIYVVASSWFSVQRIVCSDPSCLLALPSHHICRSLNTWEKERKGRDAVSKRGREGGKIDDVKRTYLKASKSSQGREHLDKRGSHNRENEQVFEGGMFACLTLNSLNSCEPLSLRPWSFYFRLIRLFSQWDICSSNYDQSSDLDLWLCFQYDLESFFLGLNSYTADTF